MNCPHCNAPIENGDKFCNNCGADLSQLKRCPHCNAIIEEGDRFCNNCGADISIVSDGDTVNPSIQNIIPDSLQPRIASSINDDMDFEEESFFNRYKVPIIIAVVLLVGVVGYFIYHGQQAKPSEKTVATIDTTAIDSVAVDTTSVQSQDVIGNEELSENIRKFKEQIEEQGKDILYVTSTKFYYLDGSICVYDAETEQIKEIYEGDDNGDRTTPEGIGVYDYPLHTKSNVLSLGSIIYFCAGDWPGNGNSAKETYLDVLYSIDTKTDKVSYIDAGDDIEFVGKNKYKIQKHEITKRTPTDSGRDELETRDWSETKTLH